MKDRTEPNQLRPSEPIASAVNLNPRYAISVGRYLTLPLIMGLVCFLLYWYIGSQQLGFTERQTLNAAFIATRFREHIMLTGVSTGAVCAITIPVGVMLTRRAAGKVAAPLLPLATLGQAIPSIGLLALFAVTLGVGFDVAVYALIAYSSLPVLRNTMVGLRQVDQSVVEAGRGMGMSKIGVLLRIELPFAIPVLLAGLRTALILNVGTATLATFVGAGGLGTLIDNGLSLGRPLVTLTGSILSAVLALFVDWIAGIVETLLSPKGM